MGGGDSASGYQTVNVHEGASQSFGVTLEDVDTIFTPFTTATAKLKERGGLDALVEALNTDVHNGVSQADVSSNFEQRKKEFGDNTLPDPDPPNIFALWWDAYKDEMLIILTVAAVVSLILGVFFPEDGESPSAEGAIEGAAILGAVIIVTTVQAVTNYSQEKQFQASNKKNDDIKIKVIRAGKVTECQIGEVVVGDIVMLKKGDRVPADGFICKMNGCKVAEDVLSGESEPVRKDKDNFFVLRGTNIQDGNCNFVVARVGVHTEWGSNFAVTEFEETPLQKKLGVVARYIGFLGLAVAAVVFVVLCIYWLVDVIGVPWDWQSLTEILQYFITAVTIVVVAVPEGLPLAVTVALAFSMKKMMKDNNFVRRLAACETMGGATQICSDKTGTLTVGRMNVTKGVVAGLKFDDPQIYDMNEKVHYLLTQGIAINSTADIEFATSDKEQTKYMGDSTECALLLWINKLNVDFNDIRKQAPDSVKQFTFSSSRKRMSTVVPIEDDTFRYRMYAKGASEIILRRCTKFMNEDGSVSELDEGMKEEYFQMIEEMASNGLRTLCMAYRDFKVFDVAEEEDDDEPPEMKLTLISLVGIADPVRPEVPDAVRTCQRAGITVRMVTGDNILTAKNIAKQCNILTDDGIALEGPEFAKKSDAELDEILPRLQVLARSAPTDKERLVTRLQHNSELVSVTGDGANDVKALRKAHVGLAMGGGSEVAKDASDIVILDDNFTSILKSVMWGRCVFDNIRKFLQFQLTVNVAALAVAAFSALFNEEPLTAVQLLWVNLIMDSFGALALATEPPTMALLDRPPKNVAHKKQSLLSPEMWKMILGQSAYQTFVLLGGLFLIPYASEQITGTEYTEAMTYTIIFNSFILCQLFNLIACRKINKGEYNVFAGLHKNFVFLAILIGEFIVQVILVGFTWDGHVDDDGNQERAIKYLDFLGTIFDTVPLDIYLWLICIGIGFVGFIWGIILRFIPTPTEKTYKGEIFDEDEEDSEKVPLINS